MDPEVLELMKRQTEALEKIASSIEELSDGINDIFVQLQENTITGYIEEIKNVIGQVCGPWARLGDDKGFYVRVKQVPSDY